MGNFQSASRKYVPVVTVEIVSLYPSGSILSSGVIDTSTGDIEVSFRGILSDRRVFSF